MKAAYAQDRAVFLLFFLAYGLGNWLVVSTNLTMQAAPIVFVYRTVVSVALVAALVARSRRWDWAVLVLIAAAYALRLVTQLVR